MKKTIVWFLSVASLFAAYLWDQGIFGSYNPAYAEIFLVISVELFLMGLAVYLIENGDGRDL